ALFEMLERGVGQMLGMAGQVDLAVAPDDPPVALDEDRGVVMPLLAPLFGPLGITQIEAHPQLLCQLEQRPGLGNEGFRVWRAYDAVVGMCICNDRRWPETWRVMGLQGVEIIALGYNTPIANIHHREPEHLRMFHHLLSLQAG